MSSSIYRLENHPLFDWPPSASKDDSAHAAGQSDGARPKRSLGMDANVFAVSRDLELFVVDRTNSLHCIHLRQRDSTKSPDYSNLRCSPSINFPVQQLLLSENEKYLAAIGEKGIQIVELSQRARLEMHAKSNQDVTCTTFKVAEYFFLNHPTARIVKAAWHPISSQHMVVLTTDNIIRLVKNGFPSFSAWLLTQTCALFSMYNVSVNMEEPEQIFRIPTMLEVLVKETSAEKRTPGINKTAKAFLTYSPSVIDGAANVVTFAFGASQHPSWQNFTMYILLDSSEIYALCPVVPHNCVLPARWLVELEKFASANLNALYTSPSPVETNQFVRYELQTQWLNEIKGATFLGTVDGEPLDDEVPVRHEGETAQWLKMRSPATLTSDKLKLQGPLEVMVDGNKRTVSEEAKAMTYRGPPSDLLCLPSTPMVLVRAFDRGVFDILISYSGVEPEWSSRVTKSSQRLSPADSTQVYRFQGVDLKDRFPAPPTDRRVPYTGAKLLSDSTQLDRFFIYASPGIFTVSLPWLKALETFSLEADATLASMTDLESTGVHQALNLMPIRSSGCARIIGAAVLSQPTAGALLDFVTILTETDDQASLPATPSASTDPRAPVQWNCYVVDARQLYKSGLAPPPIAVVNTPNKSKGRHEVWKLPAPEAPQKIGRTPSESKEAYLWFTKWASEVRKTQVTWVQTADADITSHIDILSQTHSAQAQDLEKLKYEIGLQQQIQDVIEARIKAITDWQLNLTLRADNVLNFINSCQARLSKAEREYFGELETMARSVQALSSRADDSQAKVQSYLESEPSASPAVAAPEGQLKMIEPWVEKQGDMIESTIGQIRQLSTDLDNQL